MGHRVELCCVWDLLSELENCVKLIGGEKLCDPFAMIASRVMMARFI